ncbi:unnamed protein product [Dovyalis caffra]|uniref:Histone H4 n=1 Tax=Dovyalis caffra TaxID=77055 RepID=A0AAV1SEF8_9ROSI|nr:unnamed protein product [Dovyalis caffra]
MGSKIFLDNMIRDVVTYTEHAMRKIVLAMDVVYALKRQGCTLYGFSGLGFFVIFPKSNTPNIDVSRYMLYKQLLMRSEEMRRMRDDDLWIRLGRRRKNNEDGGLWEIEMESKRRRMMKPLVRVRVVLI